MPIKSVEEAEKLGMEELRKKFPEILEDVEKGVAKKSIKEYKTRKGREVFELNISKTTKVQVKGKEIEISDIKIATMDKETGEIRISLSG